MKKKILRFFSLLIAFCFITPSILVFADTVNGTCGTNVSWSYDGNGTLTISGSGEIFIGQFNYISPGVKDAPWVNYKNEIKHIVIEDGITRIGNYAFSGLTYLEDILMPDSVTSIGLYSFFNCKSLKHIDISQYITTIAYCLRFT